MPRWPCLLLLLVATGVQAATEVVLRDGQRVQGASVERRDGVYVVTLESGGVVTVPVDLVAQVRLTEGAERQRTAAGLTYAEPQQLAGDPLLPVDPARALEVLGRPARFRPSILDPNWTPESGFPDVDVLERSRSTFRTSLIDPTWVPRSGFPDLDVLVGSRSSFPQSPIDSTWIPEDGFARKRAAWGGAPTPETIGGAHLRVTTARNLSQEPTPSQGALEWARVLERGGFERRSPPQPGMGVRFEFDLFADRPSDRSIHVRGCAREVLGGGAAEPLPEARKVADPRYALLPIDVFETVRADARAVFTVVGETCRAVGGDLRDGTGVRLAREQAIIRGIEAYNASLGEHIVVQPTTDEAKVDYAGAVVAVVDPDVSGHLRGVLLVVPDSRALEAIGVRAPEGCSVEAAARRKAVHQVERAFAPPRVAGDGGAEHVEFFTWSSVGGEVVRHSVSLGPDGKVSAERQTVASHVGQHVDRR